MLLQGYLYVIRGLWPQILLKPDLRMPGSHLTLALKILHYTRKIRIKLQTGKSSFNPIILDQNVLPRISVSYINTLLGFSTIDTTAKSINQIG